MISLINELFFSKMIFKDAESNIKESRLQSRKNDFDESLIPEEIKKISNHYGWNLENKK